MLHRLQAQGRCRPNTVVRANPCAVCACCCGSVAWRLVEARCCRTRGHRARRHRPRPRGESDASAACHVCPCASGPYRAAMADDQLSASALRQRLHKGGSARDDELTASQIRARHAVPSNRSGGCRECSAVARRACHVAALLRSHAVLLASGRQWRAAGATAQRIIELAATLLDPSELTVTHMCFRCGACCASESCMLRWACVTRACARVTVACMAVR